MLQVITKNKLLFIVIHFLIGYLATFSFFPKIYTIFILLAGFIIVVLSNNKSEEALFVSGYIVGAEVFLRMIKSGISYEFGKYGVIIFLLTGILIGERKQKINMLFIIYIMLLLLGIAFTQVPEGESIRKTIIFNLSGPIVLGISGLYFYKRTITRKELFDLLYFIVLPIFSMVVYMYFKTPDLKTIAFGGSSLMKTSGGFGPNQVVTILGFGIFIITVFMFLKEKLSNYIFLDALFLIYFTYRGLLTFSRGGILTGAIAILIFFIFIFLYQKQTFQSVFKYLLISSFFIFGVWLYTSNVTGGMLENRYAGNNANGEKKKDALSGRGDILDNQLESFKESPIFGIGVGNGRFRRELSGDIIDITSHNELGRLLEEHGLIGLFLLLMLLFLPLPHFYEIDNFQRSLLISFYVFWFLTINHSAMRIAFPGFVYGLSLINITKDEEP
jgi:O-antigen ligase